MGALSYGVLIALPNFQRAAEPLSQFIPSYPEEMHVWEIETPALVVDLEICERNLQRVADYAREHGLRLRPHTKTHKSIRMAKRQLALGAAGLTVAKVSEAEVMLAAESPDLLVAFPIVGAAKVERLMAVARRTHVTVALDSLFAAQQLSNAAMAAQTQVGVLVEFRRRTGPCGRHPRGGVAATGGGGPDIAQPLLCRRHLLPGSHQEPGRTGDGRLWLIWRNCSVPSRLTYTTPAWRRRLSAVAPLLRYSTPTNLQA